MVVALEGVTVDAGILVAVIGNEFLQLDGGFGQVLDSKGDVLDETRGAHGARTAHAGEDARADGPVLAIDSRVFRELCRDIQAELSQTLLDFLYLFQQLLVGHTLGLCEYRRQVVIVARLHTLNLAGIHIFLILQEDGVANGFQ